MWVNIIIKQQQKILKIIYCIKFGIPRDQLRKAAQLMRISGYFRISFVQQNSVDSKMRKNLILLVLNESHESFQTLSSISQGGSRKSIAPASKDLRLFPGEYENLLL